MYNGFADALDKQASDEDTQFVLGIEERDSRFAYLCVRAVSAGEYWGPNNNDDFFEEDELIVYYDTFMDAHVFKNHDNKDVAKAIGSVIKARWFDRMKCVELWIAVDKELDSKVVRNIETGAVTDVSMGCKVDHSVCSICGNIAKTKKDFCEHVTDHRGQLWEDGKLCYEINKKPRFHDISIVLNGADKTAKRIEKISKDKDRSLEKVALKQAILDDDTITDKKYSIPDFANTDTPLFKTASRQKRSDFIKKVAQISKVLQGKIVGSAGLEMANESLEVADELSDKIKILYTKYWDEETCEQIAGRLKEISTSTDTPLKGVLKRFLDMSDALGVMLSPLEFDRIMTSLYGDAGIQGIKEDAIDKVYESIKDDTEFSGIDDADDIIPLSDGMSLSSVCDGYSCIYDNILSVLENDSIGNLDSDPKTVRIVIRRVVKGDSEEVDASEEVDDSLVNILEPHLKSRSFHLPHLISRILRVVSGDLGPEREGLRHFVPLKISRALGSKPVRTFRIGFPINLGNLGYSVYQNNRVKNAINDFGGLLEKYSYLIEGRDPELKDEFIKSAEIKKEAYTTGQGVIYGVPATYGYSALQRSRMKEGEMVGGFNRFVAENPELASLLQVIYGPRITNLVGKGSQAAKTTAQKIPSLIKGMFRKANDMKESLEKLGEDFTNIFSDKCSEVLDSVSKVATSDIYMVNNPDLDFKVKDKLNITPEKLDWIKRAAVLYEMRREDAVEEIKDEHNISDEDIKAYLEEMKEFAKENLVSQAKALTDLLEKKGSIGDCSPWEKNLLFYWGTRKLKDLIQD